MGSKHKGQKSRARELQRMDAMKGGVFFGRQAQLTADKPVRVMPTNRFARRRAKKLGLL